MHNASVSSPCLPWWRHGLVWMVLGGPALVVVAGIATFVIAARSPDPLVSHATYRARTAAAPAAKAGTEAGTEPGGMAMLPAQQGRNHAASPNPAR